MATIQATRVKKGMLVKMGEDLFRILDFQHRHPGVTLMLNATAEILDLATSGLDLAIRFGDGDWPGLVATPFLRPDLVVVGARELIRGLATDDLKSFAQLPWLQEFGTNDVAHWMKRHAIAPQRSLKITHLPGNLILEALRRGDGLTYTARCFVDEDIRSGRLLAITSEQGTGAYFIVTNPGVVRPPVRQFIKWLQQQAGSGEAPSRHSRSLKQSKS